MKKAAGRNSSGGRCVSLKLGLLTDTELLLGDDSTVAVDILTDQVIEQAATLTYEGLQSACSSVVLVVGLQVLGEMLDADREEGDLAFRAAGVGLTLAIGFENLLFFFLGKMHGCEI